MLAAAENALIDALANHRDIKGKLRAVESLPKLIGDKLLQRYVADAPAFYVVPGLISVAGDEATLDFTVAGIVRNVAGHSQARKGDGIDIGCDHLLVLAIRALHAHSLGGCTWSMVSAEMAADEIFEQAGISAIEMKFKSSPVLLDADYGAAQLAELDDFTHFHADLDIAPQAGATEHDKWLAEPPDHTTSTPDAELDLQLPGAT